MTIRFSGFNQLSGLSTDTKPTNVMAGFILFETDTRILFYFDGISWTQFTGGGAGESNTASSAGSGGVGIVLPKAGVDLPFKSINAGSSKITVTNDSGNNEIDIDVSESDINIGSLTGTLGINHGGTGAVTSTSAFNALSPLTLIGDLLYHDGSDNKRLAGNSTTTKKFLTETGDGVTPQIPSWGIIAIADLPVATTTTKGIVELATSGENVSGVVVQGNDSRLSDSRTPTTHKSSHVGGGSDAFISSDVLIAQSRYLERISDPISDVGRVWINSGLLKFWDNQGSPVKHVVEVQDNKGADDGYCELDNGTVPLSRLDGIVDANIGSHTSTKITIIEKAQLNSSIAYKDETGWLTDAMVSTYTNTKITTTSKSLLNSNIVYGDQNNSLTNHYLDIAQIATPLDPSSGTRRLFVDSGTGKLSVRTATGSTIDLEGLGVGEANSASNQGTGGVGVFNAKVDVDLQFKNINSGSNKISVTDDTGNKEIDIDVVEANLTHDNIGGTLGISKGGTGQITATLGFNALSPSTTLGDLIYHNGTDDVRLAGNTTTTKKFLNQTGNSSISAAPVWSELVSADLPAATTSAIGAVELATDGENASSVVVQGNDSRLSDARTPTAHKNSHKSGGGDAFVKADILIASTRYIEQIADPSTDAGRLWVETTTKNLKYWDDQGTPVKQLVEIQSNKGIASGYCDLDGSVLVPLTRLSGIVDANIGSHTSTKITITDKTQLNSAILYNDVDNDLGTHYIQIGEISAPSNPASNKHRLYIDSGDDHLKRKDSAGAVKDYDTASGGETNTMSNIGIGGVGIFKQKTSVNFEMKTLNVGSNKVTVTDDFGSDEVDIDVVESNFTLDNIGGTLSLTKGGTGQTGATAAFNALSPSTTLGDLIYHNGSDDARLSGNTTTTKKFLTQTGDGVDSASPGWNTILAADLPSATTSANGAVELATDGENAANVVVQGNDARLSDARTPTAHKSSHVSGGSDTFIKSDVLVAASRYIELVTDPTVDTGRMWLNGSLLKFWDNAVTPAKQVIEVQSNKGVASGYCDLDGSVFVPLTRLSGIVDANIGSHTSSKITITDKTHLNSAILYNDVDNDLGAHYLDIAEISTPADPASAHGRLYIKQIDSNTTGLYIKLKRGGAIVDVQIG